MGENSISPRSALTGKKALRLLFLAVTVAAMGSLLFASATYATISVKNTATGDVEGNQCGVAAFVDATYFQGVPYGYTPAMAIRMNNSWGSNRYLELAMTFTSPAYGPYRNVMLRLVKNGTTLCNYALSDPPLYEGNPLALHSMEIFEVSELPVNNPTDGYWDVIFDDVYLTDYPPLNGPEKWYLHDHGTTSETKVVCPGYQRGEWARFVGIKILDHIGWGYVAPGEWPLTVVDDNPYFNLTWDIPNQNWHTTPTSRADDDEGWEVSTWAQDWQLEEGLADISPYLDNGFRSGFYSGEWQIHAYDEYNNGGMAVHEWDLRDWFKLVEDVHGMAEWGFDKYDFSLWASHGNTDILTLDPPDEQEVPFHEENARWGKTDLEWAYIFACLFTGWDPGDQEQMKNDYGAMAGLHVMCGFRTEFGCPNPDLDDFENGADYQYGQRLTRYLTGAQDGHCRTIEQAFNMTADFFQGAGHCTRCFFTPTTLYDHLPGYGSFAIADPAGWYVGGPTYWRDWPC